MRFTPYTVYTCIHWEAYYYILISTVEGYSHVRGNPESDRLCLFAFALRRALELQQACLLPGLRSNTKHDDIMTSTRRAHKAAGLSASTQTLAPAGYTEVRPSRNQLVLGLLVD